MEYKDRLIQQLKEAMDAVSNSGEDSYVCDGIYLAIKIVESGLEADAREIIEKEIEKWG